MLISLGAVSAKRKLKEGLYKGVLVLDSTGKTGLPFIFEVAYAGKKPEIVIRNAEERIHIKDITVKGDSVNFRMPVFDTEFRCVINGNDLKGKWINHYRTKQNELRFYANWGESNRFPYVPGKSNPFFEGKPHFLQVNPIVQKQSRYSDIRNKPITYMQLSSLRRAITGISKECVTETNYPSQHSTEVMLIFLKRR